MKLEKLREIAQHKNKFSGGQHFLHVMQDHVDALLDVVEAAKAACFSPSLLSDKTAMIMRMGELHAALERLEAVE